MLNHSQYSDLNAEQFELIGRIVVEWANIEYLMGTLLSRLLFVPGINGHVYLDGMPAARLETAIHTALSIHGIRISARSCFAPKG